MYDGTYDEYIRSILGYNQNELYDYGYNDNYNYRMQDSITVAQNSQLEQSYPEIYKIVYPMISKRCQNVRGELSNDELEKMTDEIYFALESRNETQLNINLKNDVRTNNNTNSNIRKTDVTITENTEDKRETRQINRSLRDLIKILLIRELLNRPRPFPPRPPVRPPMPPGTGPRPPRPPMRPPFGPGSRLPFSRDFEFDNHDLYEM